MGFRENMAEAKKNKDSGGDFEELPLGRYNCYLVQAFRNKSKAGNAQVNMDWKILEGEHTDTKERQFHRLEGNRCDVSINIMCKEFEMFGVDAYSMDSDEDLDAICQQLTDKHPMVTLVKFKKGTYTNRKVETYLGDFDGEVEGAQSQQAPTEQKAEPAGIEIEVGNKFKYKNKAGKEVVGKIMKLNHESGTLDFPFDKGIEVDSLIEPVAA